MIYVRPISDLRLTFIFTEADTCNMGDLDADPGDRGPADAVVELAGPKESRAHPGTHHG